MWEDVGDSDSSESGDREDMDEGEGSSSHQNGSGRNTKNEEKVVDKVHWVKGCWIVELSDVGLLRCGMLDYGCVQC